MYTCKDNLDPLAVQWENKKIKKKFPDNLAILKTIPCAQEVGRGGVIKSP